MPGRPAAARSTSPAPTIPTTNITYWGAGNPAPKYDSSYRPGDNLYTNSALAIDAATGKIQLVPSVHAQRHDGLRRERQPHPHRHEGERRGPQDRRASRAQRLRLQLRSPRAASSSRPRHYVSKVTWTKGIDPKTGRPLDYDPAKDLQTYADPIAQDPDRRKRAASVRACRAATISGRRPTAAGPPSSTSRSSKACTSVTRDQTAPCTRASSTAASSPMTAAARAASSCSIPLPARSRNARRCLIRTRQARSRPPAA